MSATRADIIEGEGAADLGTGEYPAWLWDRLEWFQDLKFGLFIHWGPYSQWGCIESWPLVAADLWARPDDLAAWRERDDDLARFRRDYWALNRTFNPTEFAPEPWADLAKAAGMKYLAFTTKHHDGFCMFDTRTTDYRITHPSCPFHTHPRANIVREVFDAFRERDFAISCYFSKSDWHSPWYWSPDRPAPDRHPNYDTHAHPERWRRFIDFVHAQVEELMTGYGPLDALWLDGGQVRPPDQDIRMATMAAMGRRHQPGLIMADRTVGGPYENILTPEQQVPDEPLGHAWESCMTMGNGWAYRPNDTYKSTRTLLHMLTDIVAKGGNLLLNIGPSPAGTFDAEPIARLKELAAWMESNGEAIHGSRPIAPYRNGNVCFTRKGSAAYALILTDDESPMTSATWQGCLPADGSPMVLLAGGRPVTWSRDGDRVTVTLPADMAPSPVHVLRFQVEG